MNQRAASRLAWSLFPGASNETSTTGPSSSWWPWR